MIFEKWWAYFALFLFLTVSLTYLTGFGFLVTGEVVLVYVYESLVVVQFSGFLFGVGLFLVSVAFMVRAWLNSPSPVLAYLAKLNGAAKRGATGGEKEQ